MTRLSRFIARTLSVRLSLLVVSAIAALLTVALLVMFYYSRRAVKKEALHKASLTLETTVQQIDNILLSVEQSAGNIYWLVMAELDRPDRMAVFCQKLVETNPYIAGCAIAFEPYYIKEQGQYFMTYVHRSDSGKLVTTNGPVIQAEYFGNKPYNEQKWYTTAMEKGVPCWIIPQKSSTSKGEVLVSFCLAMYNAEGQKVGVMGVDVSISLLSKIVLDAKPSPNSYCTLLGSDGSYIIHPDSSKLLHETVFTVVRPDTDPTVKEAGEAMVAGKTGYKYFRLNGKDSYVFFKPFKRVVVPGRFDEDLGWSVGIIYPEDDIFGDYNRLLYIVLMIAVLGLFLLLVLCQGFTHYQLVPLRLLAESSQRIAEGHYDEPVPNSRQQDEVGRLQDHFQQMQQALAAHVGELKQSAAKLQEQGEVLRAANEQAREADRVKTAFLHNMSNQMTMPVNAISSDVTMLCEQYADLSQQDTDQIVANIQKQGLLITDLLNELLEMSQERIKEE